MDRMNHLESEITELRQLLNVKEKELNSLRKELIQYQTNVIQQTDNQHQQFEMQMNKSLYGDQLPKWAIERYSRQILLSDIGVKGQEKICTAKVLVVGAGGLGCPAAMYLAGAGVGEIGIVDYDTVELTNIHRQILHGECDQNMSKAESAAQSLRSINSRITVTPYSVQLSPTNAIEIISKYDIVLDCTDNVPTRYLLNDACLTTKKPLISGSALKMEGQLTIYGYRAENNPNEKDSAYRSPCYRCVFPTPPAADAVGSCSSNGVCGPVTGIIGSLQALEAIKCIVGHTHEQMLAGRLLLFDGDDSTFGIARLRPRSEQCAVCSDQPTITRLIDYEVFCKAQANEKDLDLNILPSHSRMSALELAQKLSSVKNHDARHLLVDVRNEAEFNMCRIDGAVNRPMDRLQGKKFQELLDEVRDYEQVTFVCRRGNDSQVVAKKVLDVIGEGHVNRVNDLNGGLHAWAKYVDANFPVY
ncbi:adenylyltransferase and sulfurtransferase MOCS3 isoform X4 [Plodia interpunctella]|uniref:adenylyltransferase and sulfurtransferase MOCS3 isoform X4 n=1 Tax=Plodia interpunctella TaxID=58824 RepID=UPI0023678A83|nr:adenylyltransferase and sulfurtransferase MOCS3 isoform X4 [Plodia interpunctella]